MIASATGVVYYTTFSSPIGELHLTSDGTALTGLSMSVHRGRPADAPRAGWQRDDSLFKAACHELNAYFRGELFDFTLPLKMEGTPFQKLVWNGLRAIPYGETVSYAELARTIGRHGASRAVGSANGRNPIAIIVPCHRVIAADGTLGGFGGGLDRKEWLLSHETTALEHDPVPARGSRTAAAIVAR
jgi:methylated-DNA-[protein]-cysteine S-methyltransferase